VLRNSIGFDGQTFHKAADKKLALRHLQAGTTGITRMVHEVPGRFMPLGILPTWDMGATVAELHRLSKMVSITS